MVVDMTTAIPPEDRDRDRISAHKIAVMVLIKEFCSVKVRLIKLRYMPLRQAAKEGFWIHNNQHNRDIAITLLKLIQNPDFDLKKLNSVVIPILHKRTYKLFVDRLHELRKGGISGLMDYVTTMESLIVDPTPCSPVVHKSSVIGLFLRRMLLAFDKLSFSHVTKLYNRYCQYFDAAFGDASSHDESKICDFDADEISGESDSEEDHITASQKQAEFFIAQQVSLLHANEKKALSPPEMQQKIRELLKGNPSLTEAHYLSFMNSLRVKEFCGAVENLYHHFDRNTSIPVDSKTMPASDEAACSFRYAALNLAVLHSRFGHREIALAALKEAIMVSQEVNDNICLQHSLGWYYRLAGGSPESTEVLIERSISKASELNLWYLASLGIQSLAKLKCVTTAVPASVFELLMGSDIFNCQHSMTDAMGCAYAQRAAMWTHYGNSRMANLVSQLLLFLNTSDPVRGGVYHIGESTCLALRNVAQIFAQEDHFNLATAVLSLAKDLFPPHSEYSHIWKLCDLTINFDRAITSGKWTEAEKLLGGIEILDRQEALYRSAQLFMARGNLESTHEEIKRLLSECEKEKEKISPHFHARALLLKAALLMQTPNASEAIPPLMTCLDVCSFHHLSYLEAQTIMYIASIQLTLGLPGLAIRQLDTVFITFLAHGSFYDKGCCYLLYAKCVAATAKEQPTDDEKRNVMLRAAGMCDASTEYFLAVKAYHRAKYAFCWLAHLYNQVGMVVKRNYYAHQYRILDQQFPHSNWTAIPLP